MKHMTNRYELSRGRWNPFVGCRHDCIYCKATFQAQLKRWAKSNCKACYEYIPHMHYERLDNKLSKTGYMEYIWTCGSGDIAFCRDSDLTRIIDRIKGEPDKLFHIQSKNPKVFHNIKFPRNVALGVTIETDDDDLYKKHQISKAPLPSHRFVDFLKVKHPIKFLAIEPIFRFTYNFIKWIEEINPVIVWLGYESHNIDLEIPEPTLDEFWYLYKECGELHIPVIVKTIKS